MVRAYIFLAALPGFLMITDGEYPHAHIPALSFQTCVFKSHEPLTYTRVLDRHWQVPCKPSAGLAGDDWCSPFNVHQRFQILLYTTNHKSLLREKPWDSAVSSLCVIVKKEDGFLCPRGGMWHVWHLTVLLKVISWGEMSRRHALRQTGQASRRWLCDCSLEWHLSSIIPTSLCLSGSETYYPIL